MPKERLDLLLVQKGLAQSRQKAQREIMAGNVLVNENVADKPGVQVDTEAPIRLKETFPYVSRGALKLIHALDHFKIDVLGKTAADIGSSTGGFTEVLLERGAVKVYAVDSGTNQLDWKLRSDSRVAVMENTNARSLDPARFEPRPSFAAVDVSFISVTKIFSSLITVLEKPFGIAVLIKPQFELSPEKIGKKGLVPEKFRPQAIESVLKSANALGLKNSEVIESPVTGAKSGNVEYLVYLIG